MTGIVQVPSPAAVSRLTSRSSCESQAHRVQMSKNVTQILARNHWLFVNLSCRDVIMMDVSRGPKQLAEVRQVAW